MKTSKKEAETAPNNWPPRLMREEALKEIAQRLSVEPRAAELRFEQARLLTELGRSEEAKRAYLELLALAPDHFGALNNLGALLYSTGFRTAAHSCYAEAAARHPDNPVAHVNLANLLRRNGELDLAREHFEIALRLAPEHAEAHQGLSYLFMDLGDEKAAEPHRRMGFRDHAVTVLPYRGQGQPLPVILLVSAMGGNVPIRSCLDDHLFLVTVIVTEFYDNTTPLPPHRLVINSISDADLCRSALEAAEKLTTLTKMPVINPPSAVFATGRVDNARRLGSLPGVVTPSMMSVSRMLLEAPDAFSFLAGRGFESPFLLRTPGFHNGQNFFRVELAHDLKTVLTDLPGQDITVMQFLDARSADGKIRKYRVMMINGEIFPLHAAVAHQWKIHYVTAEMADNPEHRLEDEAFLNNMAAALGSRAMMGLEHIRDALGLDYAGVDFSLDAMGNIVLFEANATMVVTAPEPDECWTYRRAPVERIMNAIRAMLISKAA